MRLQPLLELLHAPVDVELAAARQLAHPALYPVHDHGEHDGQPYVVVSQLEGEGLDESLARVGRLGSQHAVSVICEVLPALEAAHRSGLVHGALRPESVFSCADGRSLLRHLGYARARAAAPVGEGLSASEDVIGVLRLLQDLLNGFEGASVAELPPREVENIPKRIIEIWSNEPGMPRFLAYEARHHAVTDGFNT